MTRKLPELTAFDLRLLQVFDAVVTAGSFTAAEVRLNKSKSAISTDIAALETRLGVKLCRRGRAGFGLTDHGEKIHEASLELFRGMSGFRDSVGRIVSRVAGEFTLAMDDDLVPSVRGLLSETIRLFIHRNPDIFIDLRSSAPVDVTHLVLDGAADVGINVTPRNVSELAMHPLFSESVSLYCGSRHPLFACADCEHSLDCLAQYDCIDVPAPGKAQFGATMSIKARASNMESRLMLILTGRYLGCLSSSFARPWIESGEIRSLNLPNSFCNTFGYAIHRRDVMPNAARDLFLGDLMRTFKASHLQAVPKSFSTERIGCASRSEAAAAS